jgi:hypothetical protein
MGTSKSKTLAVKSLDELEMRPFLTGYIVFLVLPEK